MEAHPTTRAVDGGDPPLARQPFPVQLAAGRGLGLERGVAGGDPFGVDADDVVPVGVAHLADDHVRRQVLRAARALLDGAHDDVRCVRQSGAALLVDRDDRAGADLVELDEPDVGQPLDVVRTGRLADLQLLGEVADPHESLRRSGDGIQRADAGRVRQTGEPLGVGRGIVGRHAGQSARRFEGRGHEASVST